MEKAYDRVPREELWYCMRKSGVAEKYGRVVQDMTVLRCAVGQTEEFNVEVGLHQGSALSPFLFAIVMDQLSEEVRQESPWTMMFADDIVICSESREQVEENLERWRFALERRGMKVSRSKTEYMCVNEREGSGTVRLQGEEVKKVQEFKYLGSTVQSNGEGGKEVKKRVQAGWNGWRKVSGVLCDQKISARIKGKVYRTVVRPAMLYGLETVSLRKRQESELENFNWSLNTSSISKKAQQHLYCLRRLRKAHFPNPILTVFYIWTIESVLSSCITAWFGNCTISDHNFPAADIMASSSSVLCEDQLQCPICLDVFTDPVSTPCGHNFCMLCLKEFWDSSSHCQCPVCKTSFSKRPELCVNTFISALAAPFKKSFQVKSNTATEKPTQSRVFCDICCEKKCAAVKSCLICMASYCKTHLEPHERVSSLKKHKLMDPVENLEDYICKKHERPLELFCIDDQTCVCQFCTETDHKTHYTVPLEEESGEKKIHLEKQHAEVQQMIQERLKKIEEIKHSVKLNKKTAEKEKTDIVQFFNNLMRCIERNQAELLKVMEEKQKSAERQAEEFIKDLEQEITELKRRNTELEQLSHTEDHLHLLQIYPSLCSPPHTQDWTHITINPHLSVETLRRALSQLQETFREEMEKLPEIKLKRIQQYAVDVTLDPDTAHPYLILSDDGKQVTCGDTEQNLPDNPQRFDRCPCVLGKEGFTSGRFYYEVQVRGKTDWDLGVVRESINRKGKITYSHENGYWCVFLRNETEYEALDSPPVPLSLKQAPQKVGVFVDYEEGLISFYDVDAKSHIYSFTGQTFTEKLYPFFCPYLSDGGINSALIICPVNHI
ncbi:hypothetical protein QTP86_027231 [Hemibagrus guttatus]|nr:hypothetical protein QTP86_027231 [Hemibagrus guttatus]